MVSLAAKINLGLKLKKFSDDSVKLKQIQMDENDFLNNFFDTNECLFCLLKRVKASIS